MRRSSVRFRQAAPPLTCGNAGQLSPSIHALPSGSLRVRVYSGIDPVKKTKMYLEETVPAGPDAWEKAEAVRAGFVAEVYQRRNPRTDATVEQLIERHLKDGTFGPKTRKNYRGQADKHVVPLHRFHEGSQRRC